MNNPDIPDLSSHKTLLQQIENKRVPADPVTRRTFNDDHVFLFLKYFFYVLCYDTPHTK